MSKLRDAVGAQLDIEVVGEASDGVEAVKMAADLRPEVELMDIPTARLARTGFGSGREEAAPPGHGELSRLSVLELPLQA